MKNYLIPSQDGVPELFTFEDGVWLSKNGIDYRDFERVQRLRQREGYPPL